MKPLKKEDVEVKYDAPDKAGRFVIWTKPLQEAFYWAINEVDNEIKEIKNEFSIQDIRRLPKILLIQKTRDIFIKAFKEGVMLK